MVDASDAEEGTVQGRHDLDGEAVSELRDGL